MGASSNVTCSLVILATPTQILEGIQFHLELSETTTTSWAFFSRRFRCNAAVCPDIPAPKTTTLATAYLLRSQGAAFVSAKDPLTRGKPGRALRCQTLIPHGVYHVLIP